MEARLHLPEGPNRLAHGPSGSLGLATYGKLGDASAESIRLAAYGKLGDASAESIRLAAFKAYRAANKCLNFILDKEHTFCYYLRNEQMFTNYILKITDRRVCYGICIFR